MRKHNTKDEAQIQFTVGILSEVSRESKFNIDESTLGTFPDAYNGGYN